jgi:hypothetical protein
MIRFTAHASGSRAWGRAVALAAALAGLVLVPGLAVPSLAAHHRRSHRRAGRRRGPSVLRVGRWKGIAGQYSSIQAAVDAAKPGNWILVGPGDYHERADHRANRGPQPSKTPAGVIIATPGIHLRGMDSNRVVVDGTKPGSPRCSSKEADQDLGVRGPDGTPLGRNGILAWKADNVSVENLTACNFLNGAGSAGNEIWWNGGDGTGQIGLHNFYGSYLTATSTFYKDGSTAASYAIFSSNASGGRWDHMYASNMSDSNFYIGACRQVCDQTVDHVRSQYSSQGYSGTNAGGKVVIENSEFDHNKSGFTAGALNNDDWPSPQDGACPGGATSPITHSYSCWVFMHNYVHDNNNPNVPGQGIAGAAPTGTGLLLYGGRDNTIMDNVFANNGAWGVAFVPYPDTETPPDDVVAAGAACQGGVNSGPPSNACLYDDWGNAIVGNTFHNNGTFGNNSNADFGEVTSTAAPTNCFQGNVEQGGGQVTSSPSGLQQSKPVCDRHTVPPDPNPQMTNEVACDSQALGTPCAPGSNYPQQTRVDMPPLPSNLPSMPDACAGVPANPWCPEPRQKVSARKTQRVGKLTIRDRLNEAGTIVVRATVQVSNASRLYRFKAVRRSVAAHKTTRLRLKLSRKALRAVRRALRRHKRLRARITVTARDRAGNVSSAKLSVRLKP